MSSNGSDLRSLMESSSRSDWDLLAAAADGDSEAFQALVESHQERLVRVCRRLLRDHEEALDVTQEVFLKTFRKAGAIDPRGQLFTWLYRVAVNNCLNRLRRRKIVRFLRLERKTDAGGGATFEPTDSAPDPHSSLESKREWAATRRAIEALPATQRTVLLLAKLEGLSYREIAEVMDISVGAVESRLFRAMRSLEAAHVERGRTVSPKDVS